MKVLLIDDHPLILSAMQSVIRGLGDNVQMIGVETAGEARSLLRQQPDFDLVLLDLQLGETSGFDVLLELRANYPALPVVVVTASNRPSDMLRCIDSGAMGYVPKRASNEMLFEALHLVMSGGIYVPPMKTDAGASQDPLVADSMSSASMTAMLDAPPAGPSRVERDASGAVLKATPRKATPAVAVSVEALGLTPRQTEVLVLLLQGQPNKEIARLLGLSVETVKDHVAAVLRSLGVHSRTQAVLAISQMQHSGAAPLRTLRA